MSSKKEMLLMARTVRKKKLAIGTVTTRHAVSVRASGDASLVPPNRAWICAHDMLKEFERQGAPQDSVRIANWVFEEIGVEKKMRDLLKKGRIPPAPKQLKGTDGQRLRESCLFCSPKTGGSARNFTYLMRTYRGHRENLQNPKGVP